MNQKKFAKLALNEESKTFVVYVAALEVFLTEMIIYPSKKTQIAALKQDEVFTKVLSKYINYADVFSFNFVMKLPENTGINKHAIKLEKGKQPSYRLIYSLGLVELQILETYIKIYLKIGFIQPFKSPAISPILFD